MNRRPAQNIQLKAISVTHEGRVRDENEDAVFCDPESGLFILADGMEVILQGRSPARRPSR